MVLRLSRNDILLLLPPETEQLTRSHEGIQVHTLTSQTYDPVHGKVLACSNCKSVKHGDEVFFQIFTFDSAKERAYGDSRNAQFEGEYRGVKHFAFKMNHVEQVGMTIKPPTERWHMIIREDALYFIKRGNEIIPLNGFTVAEPIKKNQKPLSIVDRHYTKDYEINTAKVLFTSETWLQKGDIVQTLRHCDITIEEQYNNPILPDKWFIIESKNIISKFMDKYIAGKGRVIIQPDKVEQEVGGLIDTSKGKEKLLKGLVISVGEGCDWKEGERVGYARNSGMPIPDTDYLVLQDMDIFFTLINE